MQNAKFLFLLIVSFSSHKIYSQSFTLAKLEKFCVVNVSDIEDSLLKNHFEFDSFDTSNKKMVYVQGRMDAARGKGRNFIYIQILDSLTMITYIVTQKETYQNIKSELKSRSYEFLGTENNKDQIEYWYKNQKFGLHLSTQVTSSVENNLVNVYVIQIMKLPNNFSKRS